MKLESKYDINQEVWNIRLLRRKEFVECKACEGTGRVTLNDNKPRMCPECHGNKGKIEWFEEQWQIYGPYTIGQVRIKVTNLVSDGDFDNVGHYKEGANKKKVVYMFYETGIDSGSLFYEETLFESKEKAQQECEVRNKNENRHIENRS